MCDFLSYSLIRRLMEVNCNTQLNPETYNLCLLVMLLDLGSKELHTLLVVCDDK